MKTRTKTKSPGKRAGVNNGRGYLGAFVRFRFRRVLYVYINVAGQIERKKGGQQCPPGFDYEIIRQYRVFGFSAYSAA